MPKLWQILLMQEQTKTVRRHIKGICSVQTFEELLESCILTDEDKELLRLHYLKGKDFRYIGDMLGYSESTIKRRHRKILSKFVKLL